MQCDTLPGQALHVGHGGVMILVRKMRDLLFQNRKDAGRCAAIALVPLLMLELRDADAIPVGAK